MLWHLRVTHSLKCQGLSCRWNAAFCKQLTTMGIPMVFSWFSSSSLTVPKAAITIGITAALTSHNFCNCNLKSWYLVISSSSLTLTFWSPGTAIFSLLFINDYNIWSSVFYFFICLDCKVSKYLTFVIFQHWLWLMREPFVFTFNLKFPAQEPVYIFPCFSCLFLYWFPARTEHELTIWVTLSTFYLQSLHSGDASWWSMPFFIAFVLSACSWAAHVRLSVSRFSQPAFSHCLLLWSCIPSVSLRNWSCSAFSFHASCLSFSRFILYSSHQSLFVVVTLQLQLLEVSRCCLQHNQRG